MMELIGWKDLCLGILDQAQISMMLLVSNGINSSHIYLQPLIQNSCILSKITRNKVKRAILVIPHYASQQWFPSILSMMISFPVKIPSHIDLLMLPHN